MKRMTALLCLCLTLFSLIPLALAAPGNAMLFTEDQRNEWGIESYVSSTMASIGDTVYILCGKEIYAFTAGQEKPVLAAAGLESGYYASYDEAKSILGDKADTLIYALVSSKDMVYGLNWLNGKLFPLTFDNGNAVLGTPIQLDWSGLAQSNDEKTVIKEVYRLGISGNRLYAMFRDNDADDQPVLAGFDLSTGAKQVLDIPFVQDMTTYKDGKLLVKIFDAEKTDKPVLAVYDPADNSVSVKVTFGDANEFGFIYQQETDTLYYATTSKLMALNGFGTAAQIAYVPAGNMDNNAGACSAALLPGSLYVLNTPDGLIVRNTNSQDIPTGTLSVYGGQLEPASTTFTQKYSQTPVTYNDDADYTNTDTLVQTMVSGDNSYDIYSLLIQYQDLQNLIKKGYCQDLSASNEIGAEIANMYPFIQDTVSQDGRIYAVPVFMDSRGLCMMPDVWEEAGLKDKVPSSFMGLLDFLAWWSEEGQDEHPDVQLLQDVTDYGEALFKITMSQYVYTCQAEGRELSFDTPLFRTLMQALEKVDVERLNKTITNNSRQDDRDANALLIDYGDWISAHAMVRNRSNAEPLILPMEEGGPKHIPVFIEVLFINPLTRNMDIALKYLENALESMNPDQHVMMYPNDNKPVPLPGNEQLVAGWQDELDKQEKLLKKAKPEDKKDIETTIQSYKDLLAKKDNFLWSVSAETIARYRELAPLCFTTTANLLNYQAQDGSSEINTLIERYRQKKMSLDQFITEADSKIQMILSERQ
jgi:hypothetical protein